MQTLEKYLAEYITTEIDRGIANHEPADLETWIKLRLQQWIKDGIEAYQATENCYIVFTTAKEILQECTSLEESVTLNKKNSEQDQRRLIDLKIKIDRLKLSK